MQEKTAAGKTGTSNKSLDEKTTYRFGKIGRLSLNLFFGKMARTPWAASFCG